MNAFKQIGIALGLVMLVSTAAFAKPVPNIVLDPAWIDMGDAASPMSVEYIGKSGGDDVYKHATVTYSPSPAHVWSYDGNITDQSPAHIKTVVETQYGVSGLTLVSSGDAPVGSDSKSANILLNGIDYLAIHFGQGELLFHWLTNLNNVTFSIDGLPRGYSNYRGYTDGKEPPAVPLPAAAWLFGSVLLGFVSLSNRRKV